jgi:hypothetical protein
MPTRRPRVDSLLSEIDRQRLLASNPEEQARRQRLFKALEELNRAPDWWNCHSPAGLRTLAGLVKRLATVLREDNWSHYLDLLRTDHGDKVCTIELIKEAWKAQIKKIACRLQRFMDANKGVIRIREWLERLYDELINASDQSAQKLNKTQIQNRHSIPPNQRTRPMTLREAARLMGYTERRSEKDAVKVLRASITAGMVLCESLTRQQHVFSKKQFPAESVRNAPH